MFNQKWELDEDVLPGIVGEFRRPEGAERPISEKKLQKHGEATHPSAMWEQQVLCFCVIMEDFNTVERCRLHTIQEMDVMLGLQPTGENSTQMRCEQRTCRKWVVPIIQGKTWNIESSLVCGWLWRPGFRYAQPRKANGWWWGLEVQETEPLAVDDQIHWYEHSFDHSSVTMRWLWFSRIKGHVPFVRTLLREEPLDVQCWTTPEQNPNCSCRQIGVVMHKKLNTDWSCYLWNDVAITKVRWSQFYYITPMCFLKMDHKLIVVHLCCNILSIVC